MAGMDLGTARIRVQADTAQAEQNLNKLKTTGEGLSSVGKALMPFSVAIGGIGLASIKASADAGEMKSKFNTVFGDLSKDAEKWADTYADSIGRSKYQIQEAISNQSDLYTGMGMSKKEALELSKSATTLAMDLGSFNNVNDDQAIEAMTKAMMGETESMKALGVNLSDTIMQQSEFVKSSGKSWKEMTLAEKAQARYNEALKQSPNALGDAERTSQSFTNQVKAMKGNFEEFAVVIGDAILPLLEPLIQKFNDFLSGIISFTEKNPELVGKLVALAGALAVIPPVLFATGKAMQFFATASKGTLLGIGAIAGAIALLGVAFLPIETMMPNLIAKFENFLKVLANRIIAYLPEFTQKAVDLINAFFTGFTTNFPILLEGFITLVSSLAQTISTLLPHFLASAGEIIRAIFNGFVTNAPILVGKIADIMVNLLSNISSNLPTFLQKGIEMITNMISGIGKKMPEIVARVFKMVTDCLKAIGDRMPQFMAKGMEIVLKIIEGLWQNRGKIITSIGDLMKGVLKSAVEAIKGFLNVGKQIVSNIKEGIAGAWSGLTGWIANKIEKIPFVGKKLSGSSSSGASGRMIPATQGISPFTRNTSLLDNPSLFGATAKGSVGITSNFKQDDKLDRRIDNLAKAVINMSNAIEQGQQINIDVPLKLDGKQLARVSAKYMNEEINTLNRKKNRLLGVV